MNPKFNILYFLLEIVFFASSALSLDSGSYDFEKGKKLSFMQIETLSPEC
jgi:hypothetical protein